MKLVVISDTHDRTIKEVPKGDVLIHCGDYSIYGEFDETKKFFDWFSSQPHKHKIVIPGNHEVNICPLKQSRDRNKILDLIKTYHNVHFLIDEEVIIDGIKFYGTPWCGGDYMVMNRWGFYIHRDDRREVLFDCIPEDTDVLITHTPAYDILDKYQDRVLGCPVLLERIRKVKPLVHVCGHIHSSNGYVQIDGTHHFNCANLLDNTRRIGGPCHVMEIQDGTLKNVESVKVKDSETKTLFELVRAYIDKGKPKPVVINGVEYPPEPEKVELPDSVFKPDGNYNTTKCIYCHVEINKENEAFTSMRGTMCKRCFWRYFD